MTSLSYVLRTAEQVLNDGDLECDPFDSDSDDDFYPDEEDFVFRFPADDDDDVNDDNESGVDPQPVPRNGAQWENGPCQPNVPPFQPAKTPGPQVELPEDATVLDFFKQFFTEELVRTITTETNRYAAGVCIFAVLWYIVLYWATTITNQQNQK